MHISKKDALTWFTFFAALPEDEPLGPRQTELVYAVFAQLDAAMDARLDALRRDIPQLQSLEGRTLYVGDEKSFPGGCRSCLFGSGLSAIRKTNRCNLACPFCYDHGVADTLPPIGEDMWEIGGTRYRTDDIDTLLQVQRHPSGVAYVYMEPFLEIEAYYPAIERFHRAGVYQHLYTNGTLATEENLRALGKAGLDELRFNLGATNISDKVLHHMALAKRYIPHVGAETPMTPAFFEQVQKKREAVLATGLEFINCAELHVNPNNLPNYLGENLYIHRHGYISPVWSRELTTKLMAIAQREQWGIVIHDCSNHTKFIRDMNLRSKEGGWFGASAYQNEFPSIPFAAFLPILRDDSFRFVQEEQLPDGYRPGQLVL